MSRQQIFRNFNLSFTPDGEIGIYKPIKGGQLTILFFTLDEIAVSFISTIPKKSRTLKFLSANELHSFLDEFENE